MKTLKDLNRLLRPFHGAHGTVPKLPVADVFMDFGVAVKSDHAA
jgi:hypothetical protein